jgi:hypothetical protein
MYILKSFAVALIIVLLGNFNFVQAKEVKLSVSVVERTSDQTINDFVFSEINPNGQGKVYI